jgi:hypothetical protein
MNSVIQTTIKNSHVQSAIEKYLREIQVLGDDESVRLEYDKDFPLTIHKEQEVTLTHTKW